MSKPYLEYDLADAGDDPKVSIIWMHGLGDHGSSFVPLVPEFNLTGCPSIRFIFPHAPERPITINNGYDMRGWFDIFAGFDSADLEDTAGVKESQTFINELIEQEKARGVPANKIILAGFSQGCAMALYTGLCHPEKLGGIIGLSGYIPLIRSFAGDRSPANQDTPVFLGHGTHDEVVPFSRAEDALKLLQSLNYKVDWHPYNMTHTMSMPEINDISNWLRKLLA